MYEETAERLNMVALTITIGAAVLLVGVIAAVRSLRRASRRIDDILDEELAPRDDDEPVN